MQADDKPLEMTVAGSSTVTVKNVLVGEVWVGSGQSNMAMPMDWGVFGAWGTPECTRQFKESDHPNLRMFTVAARLAGESPARDVTGEWQVCKPMGILKWSAAGYFFGLNLQKELGSTPVGIINSSLGGTQIAPWIDRKTVLGLNTQFTAWHQQQWDLNAIKMAEFDAQLAAWQEVAARAKVAGAKLPAAPKRPVAPWPGSLYSGMIAPLMPYAIRGIAWYQGESNSGAAVEERYVRTLEALIKTWRDGWKQGDLPFVIVQLPNFSGRGPYVNPNSPAVQTDPVEKDPRWPPVREAQRRAAAAVPNADLLVAIDIGNPNNIHPVNKAELGRRWALLAMNLVYGKKDLVASGPLFAGCEFKNDNAVVRFTSVGGGLAAKGDGALAGFAISGKDGAFVWAKAVIDGDTVVLSADEIKAPAAVRYAWAENPIGNLVNREGFPASPFKTDGVASENIVP